MTIEEIEQALRDHVATTETGSRWDDWLDRVDRVLADLRASLANAPRELSSRRADTALEALASWMMSHGFATGHGDTVEGLLTELTWQFEERRSRADTVEAAEVVKLEWPVGDAQVIWFDPDAFSFKKPVAGKELDWSLATRDRAQLGDRFYSEAQVREMLANVARGVRYE